MNKKVIEGFTFEKWTRYKITRPKETLYWTCRGIVGTGIFFTEEPGYQPDYWLGLLVKRGEIEVCKESKIKKLLDAIDRV